MRTNAPWLTGDTITRPWRISSSRNACSFGGAFGGAGGVGAAVIIFKLAGTFGGRSAKLCSVTSDCAFIVAFKPKNSKVRARAVAAAMVDNAIDTDSG